MVNNNNNNTNNTYVLKNISSSLLVLLMATCCCNAFTVVVQPSSFTTLSSSLGMRQLTSSSSLTTTSLSMAANKGNMNDNEEFMKWAKASRFAQADDNVIELVRPLGLVLKEDEYRNVYVETVAPQGNAARSGKIKEGDIITMCSATFGDEMWSTRGVGLSRVLTAIRLRAGATVKIAFESPSAGKKKKAVTLQQIQAREDAAAAAQAKKDALLKELEADEKKLNPKKFFGLF